MQGSQKMITFILAILNNRTLVRESGIGMNKDKLIGLIIKKDTYKDTKVTQADILRKK